MQLKIFWNFMAAATVIAAVGLPASLRAQVSFSQGVASGEVTAVSAVVWTRADQSTLLTVEVSTDPLFTQATIQKNVLATGENDFTAKALITDLTPDHTYFYRWRADRAVSDIGTFRTAPAPGSRHDVRFTYAGDSDGTKVGGQPFYNNFEVLDAARREDPDFFVYLGDTIYGDSSLKETPDATLGDFRTSYQVNRQYDALRNLLKSTSTYAIWDDHEVRDNFAGQTVDPGLFAAGRQAFLEYMPLDQTALASDPGCGGRAPFFRVFHWGKDVDVIILDERTCRSPSAQAACSLFLGVPDPAPTLPPFLRVAFGFPPSPPPGCLDAIFQKNRTLLGPLQKARFEAALQSSKAKFKFVINGLPIQQLYALPYDRWEGYGAERNEILNFIRQKKIRNVIFLTTDTHANIVNQVFIDRFHDPQAIAEEFVNGPIATTTFQDDLLRTLGPAALFAFNRILDIVGVDCRHLDAYSYGIVDVNASSGTATIALKDDQGNILHDQQNPRRTCVKTIGSSNFASR